MSNKFKSIDVLSRQLPGPSDGDLFNLEVNCFLLFCRDLAVFIFPTLLDEFIDQIQNRDNVLALWTELHKAHIPSILNITERVMRIIKYY